METGKVAKKNVNDKQDAEKSGSENAMSGKSSTTKEDTNKEGTEKEDIGKRVTEKGVTGNEVTGNESKENEITGKEEPEKDIADEDTEKESSEIDIYIFSNGQMYSPPRKYHLRADELQFWDATLSFLARSQYGSLHSSIELHELDGRKVEDPKRIRDCAVYVAVVPPDPFIYAGYDKYLVKATKSYERRLFKRSNNGNGPTSPDNTRRDSVNFSIRDQELMPALVPVSYNEMRHHYPSFQKNEGRKSSLKNSSQKLTEKIKPVANQVSQRPNISRKPTLKSPSSVAKGVYSNRKVTPRNSSKTGTEPGVSGKISSIAQSINRIHSPSKPELPELPELMTCKHSSRKLNESLPQLETSRSSGINYRKTPKLRHIPKPIHTDTTKSNDTFTVRKGLIADGKFKVSANQLKAPINKLKISAVKNLPKPCTIDNISAINKMPILQVDDKEQPTDKDRISKTSKVKSFKTENESRLPVAQLPILANNKASMAELISDLYTQQRSSITNQSNSSVTRINNKYKTINLSEKDKDVGATITENKMPTLEETSVSKDNDQSSMINPVKNITVHKIPEAVPDNMTTDSSDKNAVSSKINTSIVDKIAGRKNEDPAALINKISTAKMYQNKLTNKPETNIVPEEVPYLENKDRISDEPTFKQSPTQITESDRIKELEKKVEINKDLMSKQKTYLPDELSVSGYHTENLPLNQSINIDNTENTPLTTKIRVETVEATPMTQYVEFFVEKDKSNSNLPTEKINDIKVPMMYHVPEKTLRYIQNIGTEGIPNKKVINDIAILTEKGDTVDITIKSEDSDSNNIHSFTIPVEKNDSKNHAVDITDLKTNPKDIKPVNILNNIFKDKDILHINMRNKADLTSGDGPGTQQNTEKYQSSNIDSTQINSDNQRKKYLLENNQISNDKPINEDELSISFINPKWDGTSTSIADKTSTNINVNTASDTNQITEVVQNGNSVNLKLSIDIRSADGALKSTSTHAINLDKSNSVNQLTNNEISKTPNELTRSKSLQSIENDSTPHLCCRKDKVIVYQCACCTQSEGENTNYALAVNPLNSGLQGFYLLLPVAMPVSDSVKAPCQTLDKQVQHTESLISTNVISSVKETLITVPGDGDKQTKGNEKLDSPAKRQVSKVDEEIVRSQLIMMRTEPSQTSSRYVESKVQQTNTTTLNQSTQTDWCDVLLEARAEADGRYTFYLPPLHLLQQYKLR